MTSSSRFLQKRVTRRALALLLYLTLSALVALWNDSEVESVLAAYVLAGVFVLLFVLLFVLTRGVTERPERQLDERQAQLRQRSVTRAYGLLAILVFGTLYSNADKMLFPSVITLHLGDVLWLLGCILTLPSAVLAWLEPDPPTEDSKLDLTPKGDAS